MFSIDCGLKEYVKCKKGAPLFMPQTLISTSSKNKGKEWFGCGNVISIAIRLPAMEMYCNVYRTLQIPCMVVRYLIINCLTRLE